jgi:hypothetical protein
MTTRISPPSIAEGDCGRRSERFAVLLELRSGMKSSGIAPNKAFSREIVQTLGIMTALGNSISIVNFLFPV